MLQTLLTRGLVYGRPELLEAVIRTGEHVTGYETVALTCTALSQIVFGQTDKAIDTVGRADDRYRDQVLDALREVAEPTFGPVPQWRGNAWAQDAALTELLSADMRAAAVAVIASATAAAPELSLEL